MNKYIKTLFAIIGVFLLVWGVLILGIYLDSTTDEIKPADVIVVLGASQWNGRPSPAFKARLDRAAELYRGGYAPKILVTGGVAKGETVSESSVGRDYLIKNGIPEKSIMIEEEGTTTYGSLNAIRPILKSNNFENNLFVSHGFHMMRLKKMAHDVGIENVHCAPVSTQDSGRKFRYMLRESMLLGLYYIYPDYNVIKQES